jgi:hypothetical protein
VESYLLWFVRSFHKSYYLFRASSGVLGMFASAKSYAVPFFSSFLEGSGSHGSFVS